MRLPFHRYACRSLLAPALLLAGCGIVADKDLIEVAQMGDRAITRGELKRAIRLLPPEEKPAIRTRGDVRAALLNYLDEEIKTIEANRLENEGKIQVTQEEAAQYYFARHPEEISIFQLQDPSQLGMTVADHEAEKARVMDGIEHMRRRLLNETAMGYLVQQARENNTIEISDEEWEREYTIQKSRLMHPAEAKIKGVAVPAQQENAQQLAAELRNRLETGADIDTLTAEFREANQGAPIDTTVVNDGRSGQFKSFWEETEGAGAGDYVGPIYLPAEQRMVPDGQGGMQPRTIPPLFLVCQIEKMTPATQMTLEEAKPVLANQILYTRITRNLRDDYKVEVFEDNLYDPSVDDVSTQAGPIKGAQGGVMGHTPDDGHDHGAAGESQDGHDHEGHDHEGHDHGGHDH